MRESNRRDLQLFRSAGEKGVAQSARGHFNRFLLPSRKGTHVGSRRDEPEPPSGRAFFDKSFVAVTLGAAQAMIEVGDNQLPFVPGGQFVKHVQQRH